MKALGWATWLNISVLVCGVGSPVSAAVTVIDDVGRTVTLADYAQRIVSLAPHITENVYAAGAGDKLVAVSDYSDYPEEARSLTTVGSIVGFDVEAIVVLRPDLVVAWESAGQRQSYLKLEQLGIPVFISEPRHVEDIGSNIERIGALAGTRDEAKQASGKLQAQIEALKATYRARSVVKVFYQLWDQPLMTIGGQHVISDALRLCGAENIFHDLDELAPVVSWEDAILRGPDVIELSSGEIDTSGWRRTWQRWPEVPAVKAARITELSSDAMSRPTPRMIATIELMCRHVDAARQMH